MQLKLEHFNIKIGQHKVLLNIADAKELGVNPGDRVRIRGHESLSAIADTMMIWFLRAHWEFFPKYTSTS
jgi:AMP phosphorylase